jgi:hypothetical protein
VFHGIVARHGAVGGGQITKLALASSKVAAVWNKKPREEVDAYAGVAFSASDLKTFSKGAGHIQTLLLQSTDNPARGSLDSAEQAA